MNLIFFTHPGFLAHQSMPRFARMLADGMKTRNHQVEIWSPEPVFYNLSFPGSFKKWLGYIDQYIVFPAKVKKRLKEIPQNTIFVLTDHALGPWLPLIKKFPHVVHCHDFLAQQSALDLIPENPTSKTGKLYQKYIRNGYSQGKNFISVSNKTQHDLHQFINSSTVDSSVVYNGLNQFFEPKDQTEARKKISNETGVDLKNGYFLHIGGNQWYKNRLGVVEIFDAWRKLNPVTSLPLLLIGESPDDVLSERINQSEFKSTIFSFNKIGDELINDAYAGATAFLFPSLAEGFGWPIAEAMACGCLVVTTNEAPMTEVAGNAAILIPKRPLEVQETMFWAENAAKEVDQVVQLSPEARQTIVDAGVENAKRFNVDHALDQIENIYKNILQKDKIT